MPQQGFQRLGPTEPQKPTSTSPTGREIKSQPVECPRCKGPAQKKSTIMLDEERSWVVCPECERLQREEDARLVKAQELVALRLRRERAGLSESCTFDTFIVAGSAEKAAAIKIAGDVALGRIRWALFAGKTGTGKTHLAKAVLDDAMLRGHPIRYVKLVDFMRELRACYFQAAKETEATVIARYKAVRFLAIDEFGLKSDLSEWERATLDDLLDVRWEKQLPTILITNMTAREFFAQTGDRIESRFAQIGRVVSFTWEDFRRNPVGAHDDRNEGDQHD